MPLEAPSAYFGALQILQDADGAVFLFGGPAQPGDMAGVVLMSAVGEVQPSYIHPQPHQLTEHGLGIAGRSDSTDNLGTAGGREGEFRGELSSNKVQLAWFQILCRRERLFDFAKCKPARASPISGCQSCDSNATEDRVTDDE